MPTGTTAPTSLWTANSPQLHLHSPTSPPAPSMGCCPVPTQQNIIEHLPKAPSTPTAGKAFGATSYTAMSGLCPAVHLSVTCQWLFTGWFKQTFQTLQCNYKGSIRLFSCLLFCFPDSTSFPLILTARI